MTPIALEDGLGPENIGGQSAFYAVSNIVPRPLIQRASGIYMWDSEGRRYIDVASGPVVSNIGHGNPSVAEAMAAQAKELDYAFPSQARNRPNMAYAERLAGLAGPGFERVHLSSGGSEAIENAIKFLRQYAVATGQASKTKIITREPSYHGGTIAALAMNGEVMMRPFLEGFVETSAKVPAPFTYRLPDNQSAESYARDCADALDDKIGELGAENVLAFVMEPIGGLSTGCIVPSGDYVRRVREICTRHGVHLVFDEILCGAGRTGKFLAAHHWPDALPDIVTMAKALGSGYSPLGAMLAPASMVDELTCGCRGSSFSIPTTPTPFPARPAWRCSTSMSVSISPPARANWAACCATVSSSCSHACRSSATSEASACCWRSNLSPTPRPRHRCPGIAG